MSIEVKPIHSISFPALPVGHKAPYSRLAVVLSHPIQYHIPWIKGLTDRKIKIKIFYTWSQSENGSYFDEGFGRQIKWDIPLLEGYDYQFVKNTAKKPGTHHFFGIINPTLNEEIEAWAPDYLMIHGWNFYSHLNCILYFHKKTPIIFAGDSTLLNETNFIRKLARRVFLKWVYQHVDFACYAGAHNKNYFIKHGLSRSQLKYLPHSVDTQFFSEPEEEYSKSAEEWRTQMGIPNDHLVVLYAGKLIPVKNPGFLLKLASACTKLPITFLIVGNGSLEGDLKKEAQHLGNVKFLDFQNQQQMPVIYRMGDVFILPSISETWGLCISEAMACGRPVMVSELVGCGIDIVEENKSGINFHLNDTSKCIDFIKKLVENKSLVKQMGNHAKRKINVFSADSKIENLYNMLASLETLKQEA